jgi:effector-binding domain-containing protein
VKVKKKLISVVLIIVLIPAGAIAFLLTRPSDYQAHFTAKTVLDIAYFSILNWNSWNRNELIPKFEILNKTPVSSVSMKVSVHDSTLVFKWKFEKVSDSITRIRVYVSDSQRKYYNRLIGRFFNTPFKNSVRSNLFDIKSRLEFLSKSVHYEFTGYSQLEKKSCVCMNLKSTIRGKAMTMLSNVTELNQFVSQNNLELNGPPFLVIYDWSELSDSIRYDFCFPVRRTDAVPENPKIKLKTIETMDAVKTDFYGNYSLTDVTWHNLAEEVKKMGHTSNHKIVEVFYNDPHAGGNELEWKAGIYMGVKPK